MIITIDGPAASGKSTVARLIAQKLHYYYLNSGMLYRALGYCLLHHGGLSIEQLLGCTIEERNYCLDTLDYDYDSNTGVMKVFIDRRDVTQFLKDPLIDKAASVVGENKSARDFLSRLQRTIAYNKNLIAEGRDVGSVVFPHAQVKFFLTAHLQVRALRWLNDQVKKGHGNMNFQHALATIQERDERDINRPHAPLKIASDDIVIDNSQITIEQTVELMLTVIVQNTKGKV